MLLGFTSFLTWVFGLGVLVKIPKAFFGTERNLLSCPDLKEVGYTMDYGNNIISTTPR